MKNVVLTILSLLYMTHCLRGQTFLGTAIVEGDVNYLKDGDSVKVTVRSTSPSFDDPGDEYLFGAIHNGHFRIVLPIRKERQYIEIFASPFDSPIRQIWSFVRKGDSVHLHWQDDRWDFSANENAVANRFQVSQQIRAITDYFYRVHNFDRIGSYSGVVIDCRTVDQITDSSVKYLMSLVGMLPIDKKILIAESIIFGELTKMQLLRIRYTPQLRSEMLNSEKSLVDTADDWGLMKRYFRSLSDKSFSVTPLYADYVYARIRIESSIVRFAPLNLDSIYNTICINYRGPLRDNIIMRLIYLNKYSGAYRADPVVIDRVVRKSLGIVKDRHVKSVLESFMDRFAAGRPACNFRMEDSTGKYYSLENFKGKVVLLDFWFTGCGNCLKLVPYLAAIEKDFGSEEFVFVSVSIDTDKGLWVRSLKKEIYGSSGSVGLWARGNKYSEGADPIVKFYDIDGCPRLILVDREGKLCASPLDPRYDQGKQLRESLLKAAKK